MRETFLKGIARTVGRLMVSTQLKHIACLASSIHINPILEGESNYLKPPTKHEQCNNHHFWAISDLIHILIFLCEDLQIDSYNIFLVPERPELHPAKHNLQPHQNFLWPLHRNESWDMSPFCGSTDATLHPKTPPNHLSWPISGSDGSTSHPWYMAVEMDSQNAEGNPAFWDHFHLEN